MSSYAFKDGAIHKVSPQVAGTVLSAMADEGRLTAKNVVEEARPEDSPLHPEFEWDDRIAAELWREKQAQLLIAHVIIVPDESPKQEPTRAFQITVEPHKYEHIDIVMRDKTKRNVLLENAKNELIAFKKKYANLTELASVFDAIDQLTIEMSQ